jgi:hypothetical protein
MQPMAPVDLLRAVQQPLTVPNGYLEIDLVKSTQWQLVCSAPGANSWFTLATASISTVQPVKWTDDMSLQRLLCAIVLR